MNKKFYATSERGEQVEKTLTTRRVNCSPAFKAGAEQSYHEDKYND